MPKLFIKVNKIDIRYRGVYPDYQPLEEAVIQEGRFISALDIKRKAKVIAIGRLVEKDLFGNLSAMDKNINLRWTFL